MYYSSRTPCVRKVRGRGGEVTARVAQCVTYLTYVRLKGFISGDAICLVKDARARRVCGRHCSVRSEEGGRS